MSKPRVCGSSMPMLYASGDIHHITREQLPCGLAPLLIPTTTSYTDKHLSSAFGSVMYMPVVTATWFKGHVGNLYLLRAHGSEITLSYEIFGISGIRFTDREYHALGEFILLVLYLTIICPHLLGKTKGIPCLRPSRIESCMGENLCDFHTSDTVLLSFREMILQRGIGNSL